MHLARNRGTVQWIRVTLAQQPVVALYSTVRSRVKNFSHKLKRLLVTDFDFLHVKAVLHVRRVVAATASPPASTNMRISHASQSPWCFLIDKTPGGLPGHMAATSTQTAGKAASPNRRRLRRSREHVGQKCTFCLRLWALSTPIIDALPDIARSILLRQRA